MNFKQLNYYKTIFCYSFFIKYSKMQLYQFFFTLRISIFLWFDKSKCYFFETIDL